MPDEAFLRITGTNTVDDHVGTFLLRIYLLVGYDILILVYLAIDLGTEEINGYLLAILTKRIGVLLKYQLFESHVLSYEIVCIGGEEECPQFIYLKSASFWPPIISTSWKLPI